LEEAIAASGTRLNEDLVSIEREMKDSQRESQEREAQAMAEDPRYPTGMLTRLGAAAAPFQNGPITLFEWNLVATAFQWTRTAALFNEYH
jgi:hypothetical protein